MNDTPRHTYQVLTKRAERLFDVHRQLNWTENIWMGVSVEDEKVKHRIDFIRRANAKTKFLSCEPLIGPLENMDLESVDWVIAGGESGRKARPVKEEWVWDIELQVSGKGCCFFHQAMGWCKQKEKRKTFGRQDVRRNAKCVGEKIFTH